MTREEVELLSESVAKKVIEALKSEEKAGTYGVQEVRGGSNAEDI